MVLVATVALPSALTIKQIVSLELGLGIVALLCTVVSIVAWILTENTAYALSVFRAAGAAAAVLAALESETHDAPEPDGTAIPIQRGREIRRHRTDRHAV